MNNVRFYSKHNLNWPYDSVAFNFTASFHLLKMTWSKLYNIFSILYTVNRHYSGGENTKINI